MSFVWLGFRLRADGGLVVLPVMYALNGFCSVSGRDVLISRGKDGVDLHHERD